MMITFGFALGVAVPTVEASGVSTSTASVCFAVGSNGGGSVAGPVAIAPPVQADAGPGFYRVKPGDTLEITAALSHEGSGFARTKAEIRNDGKLAGNAEITFRVVEFPNEEFRRHMEKAADALDFPRESLAHG